MTDTILTVEDLNKKFSLSGNRDIQAVKGVSFEVNRGEIFGFLGPNGAGKSTTINILTTQQKPTSGEIILDGQSVLENPALSRKKIGMVAQHNNLDRGLTARENLVYHAKYFGIDDDSANKRADDYLEKFELQDRQHDYVASFSGGMAQRLKIARALMHDPDILFLDEPTTGLDPSYRDILWEQILSLNKMGTTIFLTTHYMEEPEQLCDRIAIIDQGNLQAIGTVEELKSLIPTNSIISIESEALNQEFVESATKLSEVENARLEDNTLLLYMKQEHPDFNQILEWTKTSDLVFQSFSLSTSTLDDVFIHLTGKEVV